VLSDKPDSVITLPGDLPFPVAPNEGQRLAAVQRSGLMETGAEEVFDRLTWLAGETLQAPVALFTTLTPDRQVFKAKRGLDMDDTPRDWAFCNYTILQRGVFTVGNLARDERFKDNPAVRKDPKFRFYAGVPVVDADAFALGSLCIIDKKPRTLTDGEAEILRSLAYVMAEAVQARTPTGRLRKM
jgi:GAF domain-containing protein